MELRATIDVPYIPNVNKKKSLRPLFIGKSEF